MSSGINFAVSSLRWSVALGEGHQLQHVEGIFPASNVLLNVLNATSFSGDWMKTVSRNDGGDKQKKKKRNVNGFFFLGMQLLSVTDLKNRWIFKYDMTQKSMHCEFLYIAIKTLAMVFSAALNKCAQIKGRLKVSVLCVLSYRNSKWMNWQMLKDGALNKLK